MKKQVPEYGFLEIFGVFTLLLQVVAFYSSFADHSSGFSVLNKFVWAGLFSIIYLIVFALKFKKIIKKYLPLYFLPLVAVAIVTVAIIVNRAQLSNDSLIEKRCHAGLEINDGRSGAPEEVKYAEATKGLSSDDCNIFNITPELRNKLK